MRDFYKILGVARGADDKAIAKAYKALAKSLHPDVNPGSGGGGNSGAAKANDELRDVIEAYQVLSKPDRRSAYDSTLEEDHTEYRRTLLLAAVLTMAGSISIASLSAAYYWRSELLAEQSHSDMKPELLKRIAATNPQNLETSPAPPLPRRATHMPVETPAVSDAKPVRATLPPTREETMATSFELAEISGPVRLAQEVPANSARNAIEVKRFASVRARLAEPLGPEVGPPNFATDAAMAERSEVFEGRPADADQPQMHNETASGRPGSLPLPSRPPDELMQHRYPAFSEGQAETLLVRWYLTANGRDRLTLSRFYCNQVHYWGEAATPKASVINQVTDFVGRWPHRAYKLQPGSLEVTATQDPMRYRASFTYEFSIVSADGFSHAAGIANGHLVLERQEGGWQICAEDGHVTRQFSPTTQSGGHSTYKYAGGRTMDANKVLFGE